MGKNMLKDTNKNFIFKLESFIEKYKIPVAAVCAFIFLGLPFLGFNQYIMRIIIMVGIYSMLGLGLNILTGYTGQVSLGHAGFYAIGAYTASLLSLKLGINFLLAALGGAILASLCGLLLGLPTLRLRGTYLSIVTLGFGEIVKMILINWDKVTNGTLGLKNIPRPSIFGFNLTLANNGLYYLMLFLLAFATIICLLIIKSKIGRAFTAIKEDELAATMMGIKTTRYKILAFVLSAFITGIAGAFYASMIGFIDPNSFTFDISTLIISIVILGGMGTIRGMFLGSAILISLPEISRFLMDYRFVVYGLILVIMMRFRPQGVLGWKSQMAYKLPKLVKQQLEEQEKDEVQAQDI
ncbi:high-affinity branched-chain amino acid transport system permease protein LivH [Oxobacter pfennigii]|uniref:High-affinity branched-chain amino acid transport system permease protein LivH n=1 Tax=Oxobacter pfennigii TaxID=36849 RepID=A0A0P8YEW3_9CLOT|nr:branched-chain amino acid ABC transporter permease [Oxobacter pfennigii]KPU45711.1 high-affinity branched-chain amino acid transport system permease protein LivH [Oxobacter pfennigii]